MPAASPPSSPKRYRSMAALDAALTTCRACPRLVAWRELVATEKRAAFADETYWGRPVPGLGPADAPLVVVGLAPAAHGANRTGRMFTGDRSGDFLFAGLHELGLVNQPVSRSVDDGLELHGVRMTAPVHCAPPANKPTPDERHTCAHWLAAEFTLMMPTMRSIVALGAIGWAAALQALRDSGWQIARPAPKFGHGTEVRLVGPRDRSVRLFGCYHPSQQNTFTGRLTPAMLTEVFGRAAQAAGLPTGD